MHRKTILLLLGGIFIGLGAGVVLFYGLGLGSISTSISILENSEFLDLPEKGAPAPDFTLQDLQGRQLTLSDLRGSFVLVNFWATWCGPCRVEMPALQSRFERYSPDLRVVAVNFDEPQDTVQAFADELGLTFDILLDPGAKVQDLYRIRGYPTSIFVDREGIIQIVHIGLMTEKQLDAYLRELGVFE